MYAYNQQLIIVKSISDTSTLTLQELQGTCNNSNLKTQTLSTDYVSTIKKGVETNSNLKKYPVHCNESH